MVRIAMHGLFAWLLAAWPQGAEAPILNPGFEARGAAESWEVVTYGARAEVVVDGQMVKEGRQSLRISAATPSDSALGQELSLRGGGWYRLAGWVRTQALDPLGSPTFGTLQVQRPGGQGLIAAGPNHGGDTDWTEITLIFQAPPDGRVRIAPFLVGFGKGTGTAWFDGLTLGPVDPAQAPVRVTREPLVAGPISPLQYGQFVEYLCDLVPSMWSEKLHDGSFEGLSPYRVAYLKETDFREHPWYPAGATNRADFTSDPVGPISGSVARKIAVGPGAPCRVGIAQDGIALVRDGACHVSFYLRQEGIPGPVRVRLHREGATYASCEFRPTNAWARYRARLVPTETDTNTTLTVDFRGPGTLWLDSASLLPEDSVKGWRSDVVAAVRALKPGVIRFGGSALDDPNLGRFEWKDTLGDPDRRPPFRAWGGLQPTGPGLEEFVQFCRAVDAEPLLCVRVNDRTPRDAAEEVQYFNGGADTPMGALRRRNGHPEPYGIKYWQVGNERRGADYERALPAFCQAMKQVDPTIVLLSSYPTPGVLDETATWIDFVSPHHYSCRDLAATEGDLAATRRLIRERAHGRPIRVAVTEWNTTAGDWGPRRAMLWTLENALACARYHNLLHRHSDLVTIANRSNLINSFCSGILQVDNHRLYRTPTYFAQQLYATRAGRTALKLESTLPAQIAPDLSATLSANGDEVILFAVNDGPDVVTRPLDLSAFGRSGQELDVWTLADRDASGEPDVTNSFADPERVSARRSRFEAASPRFAYRFPPFSLSVLTWKVEKDKD